MDPVELIPLILAIAGALSGGVGFKRANKDAVDDVVEESVGLQQAVHEHRGEPIGDDLIDALDTVTEHRINVHPPGSGRRGLEHGGALVAPPRATWGALIGNPFLMISTLLWIATTVWAVWTLGADPSRDQETLASGVLGGNIGLSIGILQSHLGLRPTAV